MKVVAIIPARMGSERFYGKPLVDILGKSMIQRVYEQVQKSKHISDIYIATDSQEIYGKCISIGAKAIMTSKDHQSGTDRIYEASKNIDADIIVNVQGDEPIIPPEMIDQVCELLINNDYEMGTLVRKNYSRKDFENPNIVKTLVSNKNDAIYFSRQSIPFYRGMEFEYFYHHIGIYVYKKEFLETFVNLEKSFLESSEKLEQLRVIENGYKIKVGITEHESIGIDTKEDLEKVIKILKEKN